MPHGHAIASTHHFNQDCSNKSFETDLQLIFNGKSETKLQNPTKSIKRLTAVPSMLRLVAFLALAVACCAHGIAFRSKADLRAAVVAWETNSAERLPLDPSKS